MPSVDWYLSDILLTLDQVLHLLAMARAAEVPLTIDEFQPIADRTPYLADLRPSGKYMMEDLNRVGGVPAVLKSLPQIHSTKPLTYP